MKTIGLIGGLSPESTVHYYQNLCREYNRRFGELNFPEISIQSLNLQKLVGLFETNDWDAVAVILLDALDRLKRAGADFAAIAHVTQCPFCIETHSRHAHKSGASKEELMEAIWVAAEMRAGAAYAHSAITLEALQKPR